MRPSTTLHQELKHNFVLERFRDRKITHSQDGRDIHSLSYEELKYELALLVIQEMDEALSNQSKK